MNLNDLIDTMRTLAERQQGVEQFVFNDLSNIDAGAGNQYPLIFVTPPDSVVSNINTPVEIFTVQMWVFDQYPDNDSEELAAKWVSTQQIGLHFLRQFNKEQTANGLAVAGQVSVVRGYEQHNDALIGVKFEFQIKLTSDCTEGTFDVSC